MNDGLRVRKKLRTRQAISDAATGLFAERGFDAVTTAEIAAAADVAVGTVFNYFRSKEDLFFDRSDALVAELVATVADRPVGASAAEAFRLWHLREIDFLLDPRAAAVMVRFFRTIAASPTLQAAEHRLHQRLEAALSHALGPAADPMPAVLAAVLVALHRVVLSVLRTHLLDGTEARPAVAGASALAFGALAPEALAWGRVRS